MTSSILNAPTLTPCCYVNSTRQIQIGRIANIKSWYFEQIIFPGQLLFFEAPLEAWLEISTGDLASSILCDRISCHKLQVKSLA
ncbi:MAG: DUF1830 domain-containing protein [Microcystaceae cyanobacterium]